MKKRLSLLFACFIAGMMCVNAQVTIGTTNDPHAGAVLDLQSTNKGLLLPNVSLEKVSKFQLATDAEAASGVGMMVYNTNADMESGGVGVYVWDGAKWTQAFGGNTNPDPEPEPNPDGTVDQKIGNNTYKTYDYNGAVWMVQNSMEGTSSAQKYSNTSNVNGYYYTWAQANQANDACPADWHLPTSAEWDNLIAWVNANKTAIAARPWITAAGNAFAGYRANGGWADWGTGGHWWSANVSGLHYYANTGGMGGPTTNPAGSWYSVRCVQD